MNYCFRCVIVLLMVLQSTAVLAQNTLETITHSIIRLEIKPVINHQPLELGESYYIKDLKDSVTITKLRFYLSDILFTANNQDSITTSQRYFLMDLENPASLTRLLPIDVLSTVKSMRFRIGVDSITQVGGAQGGELDPTLGMYWTWRTGYVNFKCEGISNSCPGRNNAFLFHIGGFQSPYNTEQFVVVPVSSDHIVLELDLTPLLTPTHVTNQYKIMSPNAQAVTFSAQLPLLFNVIP